MLLEDVQHNEEVRGGSTGWGWTGLAWTRFGKREFTLDNLDNLSPPAPWTRDPECLLDESTNEQFCVYINDRFANGRGISLFTSPSIAKRVESLPAFSHHDLYDWVNDVKSAPWKIRNIPGRGNGLFATRTLHRGDIILRHTPVGVYQSDAFFPDYPLGYEYLRKTYEHLPNATKEIFVRMAHHSAGDMVMERINTNAFAGQFEGADHFLLYPETALMNHDCRPNAMFHLDPSTLIQTTSASRTIHPGEEITITYINILQPQASRQQALHQTWGFQCTCSICSGHPNEIIESDARISPINSLQTTLNDWSPTSSATPKLADELLGMYELEHLHAAKGMGHMMAALEYNAIGDVLMARRHAGMAVEEGIVNDSAKRESEKSMLELRGNPEEHWSFGKRVGLKGGDEA